MRLSYGKSWHKTGLRSAATVADKKQRHDSNIYGTAAITAVVVEMPNGNGHSSGGAR